MTEPMQLVLDTTSVFKALSQAGVRINGMSVVEESASTNAEMVSHVTKLQANNFFFTGSEPDKWSAPALLATTNQTRGRGRLGREWVTAPNTSLSFSLHVEIDVPTQHFTWLPQVVGIAVTKALRSSVGVDAMVKWPNDIVVEVKGDDVQGWSTLRKIGGVLIERVGARSVVIGVGLNVLQSNEQLPVAWASSLVLLGAKVPPAAEILSVLVREILQGIASWEGAQGDVEKCGTKALLERFSATLGARVSVENLDGSVTEGIACGLLSDGSLEIEQISGEKTAIMVGDVGHLRLR